MLSVSDLDGLSIKLKLRTSTFRLYNFLTQKVSNEIQFFFPFCISCHCFNHKLVLQHLISLRKTIKNLCWENKGYVGMK